MTTLYLVRHGETKENMARIMQGQTPGELNEKGIEQARQLCAQMRDRKIDVFVSSDLYRAVQTCTIVAQAHGKSVIQTPLLRERDSGSFTGKYLPDIEGLPLPDDMETNAQLISRGHEFLRWVRTSFPDQTVFAVGHGIINKAIQSAFFDKPMGEILRMENAEVRVLRVEPQTGIDFL